MSSTQTVALPEWVVASHSQEYLRHVFAVLSSREQQRRLARVHSLLDSHRSPSYRQASRALPQQQKEAFKYYSVAIGGHPDNMWANRYVDIEPYDRTRVVVGREGGCTLGTGEGAGQGRYFNGSWVREIYGGKLWIGTQAPLPQTAHTFLSVITRPIVAPPTSSPINIPSGSRVRTVVQLTPNYENGRTKAHPYFPSQQGAMMTVVPEAGCDAPSFRVTLLEQKSIKEANCLQSKVSIVPQVVSPGEPIVFTHLLYLGWPDHGVPEKEHHASLLKFLRLVDNVNKVPVPGSSVDDPDPPVMVNCSAGIGRTGTFIALSSLLRAYGLLSISPDHPPTPGVLAVPMPRSPLGPLPRELQNDPVPQEVDGLREQRPGMVQRNEQVALIYELLELAFTERR
ncbi:hypothetical protein ID866_4957 [Astraeus odoratus]|nr:hypothetical protein ID866_4957 [Astraeus odoratus]